jgi:hypothetical protein
MELIFWLNLDFVIYDFAKIILGDLSRIIASQIA